MVTTENSVEKGLYATAAEVDDLRRTMDQFMQDQEVQNKAVETKLVKILKWMEDNGSKFKAAAASTTMFCEASLSCSGSEGNMAHPFGVEKVVTSTTPSRCSTVCHSAIARELVPMSTTAAAMTVFSDTVAVNPASKGAGEQVSAEQFAKGVGLHDFPCDNNDLAPPRPTNLVDDDIAHSPTSLCCDTHMLKPRYLTNSVAAYSIDGVFPCLDNKKLDVQNVSEGLSAHYSVMLVPLHAQALDTGQLGTTFGSLLNFGSGSAQPRHPWPPPVPI